MGSQLFSPRKGNVSFKCRTSYRMGLPPHLFPFRAPDSADGFVVTGVADEVAAAGELVGGVFVVDADAPDTQHFQIAGGVMVPDPVVGVLEPLFPVLPGLLGKPAAFIVTPGVIVHGGVQQFRRLAAVVVDLHEVGQALAFPATVGHAAHAPAVDGVAPAYDQFTALRGDTVGGMVGGIGGDGHRTDGVAVEIEHQLAARVVTAVGMGIEQDEMAAGMGFGVVTDHIHDLRPVAVLHILLADEPDLAVV